mmetsp:Transcript_21247/g.70500  ORF Transcript_21247/g.70500 Transcript_21247/m.70500 type:complete len:87 (+) Transcript_21247:752-1012(+)
MFCFKAADAGPELFSTLQDIHNAGMLHKDISAGNIMIRIRRGHLEYFLIGWDLYAWPDMYVFDFKQTLVWHRAAWKRILKMKKGNS